MIVVDIETSGLFPEKHGIWQIGALDFYNPKNTFLEEARIDSDDEASPDSSKVNGKTEAYYRDKRRQSQKSLLEHFFSWANSVKIKTLISQNSFDSEFINMKARKYNLKIPFHHHLFDLHSFASFKYQEIHKEFLFKENRSDMGLTNILQFCGLPDKRIKMREGQVVEEGTPHNALEDARLEAECFSRIVYGKPLLKEYSKHKLPAYLAK